MKALDDYNTALQEIYDHVGFEEDWVIFPIDDRREMVWSTNGHDVKYAETIEKFNSDGDYYEDDVYTQRFYKKWIYEGAEVTMIFCDTHTDGMVYFAIFSNKNKVEHK